MTTLPPLLPGSLIDGQPATLGVMGGGQLGRMFVQAAQALGYRTAVLDPDPDSPAGGVSHLHIQTGYEDAAGLAELARHSHALTTEFENVPAAALRTLAALRPVAPGAEAVAIAQDRALEKTHFMRCGVPVAPHAVIETPSQLAAAAAAPATLLPGILKTARLGYDGKGQARVASAAELAAAWDELQRVPCVLEKMLPLAAEISVIVARAANGQMVHLPVQTNRHADGILAVTEVLSEMGEKTPFSTADAAVSATKAIANGLHYVGVLCVEFFVLRDGSLIVNEMAPRPHNSGHYSLDACDQSQFDLQVRALAGLPLVQPRQHSPAIMLNLLGDLWRGPDGQSRTPPWAQVLALPGAHLHLYGKPEARAGRKMGHLTLTGPTLEAVRALARQAAAHLGLALPA